MSVKAARKAEVVTALRSRGLQARADWLQHELPEIIDIQRNRGLLSTLEVDPETLTDVAPDDGSRQV